MRAARFCDNAGEHRPLAGNILSDYAALNLQGAFGWRPTAAGSQAALPETANLFRA
jgi:hypothetical protein